MTVGLLSAVPVLQCLVLAPYPKHLGPRQMTPPPLRALLVPAVCESQQKEECDASYPCGERGHPGCSPPARS